MSAKKGLGRGFDSLIPTDVLDDHFDPTAAEDERLSVLEMLPIERLSADPDQPRRVFDEAQLDELATSIKEHGVIQPLIVTKKGDDYLIIAGERRFRAAQKIGLKELPVLVRSSTDQQKLELALIENLQRADLNPLETATAYLKLHEQFNLKYEEIGQRLGGKAASTISNHLRLLKLPPSAKEALAKNQISEGHARQILALQKQHPEAAEKLLDLILKNDWSVRKTEQYVVGYREADQTEKTRAIEKTRSETPLTKELTERFAVPVTIKPLAKGGQLMLRFTSEEELEALAKRLLG